MSRKRLKVLNGKVFKADSPVQSVTPEDRQQMIAEAAYYRALQRGLSGGDPVDDWLQAEQEINNALLNPLRNSPRTNSTKPTQHHQDREPQQPRRGR